MLAFPEFRATRCTRYRYRYNECSACADSCPHEAIDLSDEGISIKTADCQNCSLCAAACPTEALVADNLQKVEVLKRVVKLTAVTFACAPSQASGDEIVPCLGGLDAATLALLLSRGVTVALAGSHHCATCAHGSHGQGMMDAHLEAVELLRAKVGNEKWAEIKLLGSDTADSSKTEHDPVRRHFFRRFVGRGTDELARSISPNENQPAPLKAIRIAASFSTAGRELLQIVFDAESAKTATLPLHPALPVARIDIKAGCTACEACVRACPTGAMQLKESSTAWTLGFQFSRCVGCAVCIEVCQPGVLFAHDEMSGLAKESSPVILHSLNKQRCTRCDRFFISATPEKFCPICLGDDDDFAAIFG
ncbi:MAG: 4Fe-4S dicluster domain-containing protein [Gallionella sp.]